MSQLPLPFITGRLTPPQRDDARALPRLAEAVARAVPSPAGRPLSAAELGQGLTRVLGEAVAVELTDNAWTMVSYRRVAGRLHFRLHHMFSAADDDILEAVAGFTGPGRGRREHGRAIDAFIRAHRALIKAAPQREQQELTTRGRVHDLGEIFASLNARQFDGAVAARIGWGRRAPGGRRRSIKMGVYFHEQKLIRIHPALDDERVPRHFVELVVFHEMLHQIIPPKTDAGGRRCVHGKDFRAAERRFPGYEKARAWEKAHLNLLLQKRP
ncbi:MAG: hypothetical protein NVS4B10_19770 [Myxococcales bacterium]